MGKTIKGMGLGWILGGISVIEFVLWDLVRLRTDVNETTRMAYACRILNSDCGCNRFVYAFDIWVAGLDVSEGAADKSRRESGTYLHRDIAAYICIYLVGYRGIYSCGIHIHKHRILVYTPGAYRDRMGVAENQLKTGHPVRQIPKDAPDWRR